VKRLPAALACIGALALSTFGLSGCNVRFSPYAAVVNGSEISRQQFRDALSAVAGNTDYRCTIQAGGISRVYGAGEGTYSAAFSARLLSILIQDDVLSQELARTGLAEPKAVVPIALSQLQAATAPASGCGGTGASIIAAFPASYRLQLLRFQVGEDALAAHLAGTSLAPSALPAFEASHESVATLSCVSAILVKARATAASLRSQILHGASFAALARAHSIDTSTAPGGGAIGCIPAAEFTPPLNKVIAALKTGRVSKLVSFRSDWLLLVLTQRRPESYPQLVSSLLTVEQGKVGDLIDRLLRSATVEVDPQYGTWNKKSSLPRVQPNARLP